MRPILPDFKSPPVVEVALSVQFEPLVKLRGLQMGLYWQELRNRFPRTEEQPPLEPVFERFGTRSRPAFRFGFQEGLPVPRYWFINEAGTELIQIQQDRFIHNWRKVGGDEAYPRYEPIRDRFRAELEAFRDFLQKNDLGEVKPNQCEVTYVNHIDAVTWRDHSDIGEIFTFAGPRYSDDFLQKPEDIRAGVRFVISDEGRPVGRLHVNIEPGFTETDEKALYSFVLVARGTPIGNGLAGAVAFLDLGRKWIVRAFASLTTPEMHVLWQRTDNARS